MKNLREPLADAKGLESKASAEGDGKPIVCGPGEGNSRSQTGRSLFENSGLVEALFPRSIERGPIEALIPGQRATAKIQNFRARLSAAPLKLSGLGAGRRLHSSGFPRSIERGPIEAHLYSWECGAASRISALD